MSRKRPRLIVIPFQISPREYSIFIALDDKSVERIHAYDPGQVDVGKLPPLWSTLKLNTILIGYANDADVQKVVEMLRSGEKDPRPALQFLSRGFAFKPQEGDHDGPWLDLRDKGEAK